MSNFHAPAWHPIEKVIRKAVYLDDYFGRHGYGVQFDEGGQVFRTDVTDIPPDGVFVRKDEK